MIGIRWIFGFLVVLAVGCQGSVVDEPPMPATNPPFVGSAASAGVQVAFDGLSLDPAMTPQQAIGCRYVIGWNGYDGCWRYDGIWYFTWPYGHGYHYCYFILYYSTGGWGQWQVTTDWSMCNA